MSHPCPVAAGILGEKRGVFYHPDLPGLGREMGGGGKLGDSPAFELLDVERFGNVVLSLLKRKACCFWKEKKGGGRRRRAGYPRKNGPEEITQQRGRGNMERRVIVKFYKCLCSRCGRG